MVVLNPIKRELTAKVVYYGPGLCGKTTNLKFIFEDLDESVRGKMLSLSTEADRTLFFDFLPLDMGEVKGFKVRVQLYTVPGQVFYEETRKRVLRGSDGVVFVADSQRNMWDANLQSFAQLTLQLKENGIQPDSIPIVIQYNKRDLPDISSVEEMDKALNPGNLPFFEAIAHEGVGVEDTLRSVTKQVLKNLLSREIGGPAKAPVVLDPTPKPEARPSPESTVMMDRKKLLTELGISGAVAQTKAAKSPKATAADGGDDLFESTGDNALLGAGSDALSGLTEGASASPAARSNPLEETDPGVSGRTVLQPATPPISSDQAADFLFDQAPSEPLLLQAEEVGAGGPFEQENVSQGAPARRQAAAASPGGAPVKIVEEIAAADAEALVLAPGQEICVPVSVEGRSYLLRLRLDPAES